RVVMVGRFAHRPGENLFFRNDSEQHQVDSVNAFAENPALPASLTFRFEETDRVLDMIGINGASERLDRLERNTIPRIDVSHLTFSYDDERFLMNAILPRI